MVTCYPVRGKQKSIDICRAFADGCEGLLMASGLSMEGAETLQDGAAFFWGVDQSNIHYWQQAKKRGDYYYGDNSYFDGSARGEYFRVTHNRLQHTGAGTTDMKRFNALGIPLTVNTNQGGHVVVCEQSEPFMRDVVGYRGNWLKQTLEELTDLTDREIRVRRWNRDKAAAQATLGTDLEAAHALVTFSSAAAISAALAGVPPFVGGDCPARLVGNDDLAYIEHPHLAAHAERLRWAGVLADNQWTLEEMRSGLAWEMLRG